MAKPNLPQIQLKRQAGISEDGNPIRSGSKVGFDLLNGFQADLARRNAIQSMSCFNWPILPYGLNVSSKVIEKNIYRKGSLIFFYYEPAKRFMITDYAFTGGIDQQGRFLQCYPVPIADGELTKDKKVMNLSIAKDKLADYILNIVYEPIVDVSLLTPDFIKKSAVIINDYTDPINTRPVAMMHITKPYIDLLAPFLPYIRTNALVSTGVRTFRTASEAGYEEAINLGGDYEAAALSGQPFVAVNDKLEMQDLSATSTKGSGGELTFLYNFLDKVRLEALGINGGDIADKKQQKLSIEVESRQNPVSLVLNDRLFNRQYACDIINSIWSMDSDMNGVPEPIICCTLSENLTNYDEDGDGKLWDDDTIESTTNEGAE